jgi:hypothetical protein
VTADTPIFPVAPTTRTVSMAALSDIEESKDVDDVCYDDPVLPFSVPFDSLSLIYFSMSIKEILR